ncbi:auxin-responsive protein SAUR36, partial [Hevea brasiliensis]|uniref:auxin-responsive protein SAUR36 n=1 Tax=Hevea brasiliensis TaxID=3981 RepID=UPI0025E216C7
ACRPYQFSNTQRRGALPNSNLGYIRLGQAKPEEVPKGHLAVYVEESIGDKRREVVPVIYFNHPLFGELLKDAERVYGYNHSGGIKIPCGYSKFEELKIRIAAWDSSHNSSCKWQKQVTWQQLQFSPVILFTEILIPLIFVYARIKFSNCFFSSFT